MSPVGYVSMMMWRSSHVIIVIASDFAPHTSIHSTFSLSFQTQDLIISWVWDAQAFSIEHKGFHKMPHTYHFDFISCLFFSCQKASCTELLTCPPICKLHACFSFAETVFLPTQLSWQGQILIQDVFQISVLVCQLPQFSGLKQFLLLDCFLSTLHVIAHVVLWPLIFVLDIQLWGPWGQQHSLFHVVISRN